MSHSLHRRPKLFRDPIHDVISYDLESRFGRLVFALIDTQPVQRLRQIRQLGLAQYVYHGAEHSRFSHSMGAAFMAGQMFDAIHRKERPPEILRMATVAAALLHDIGHAPFSHTFESTLQTVLGFDGDHEQVTRRIILWEDGEVFRVLAEIDQTMPKMVADIIAHRSGLYTEPIVSSQLDADRMDYLLRDGYMTGVQNYRYDSGRILEMLMHDEHGLVVDRRALQAVESYLLSRFHMYQQVYYHKTVRAAEALIEGIFKRVLVLLREGDTSLRPAGAFGRLLAAAVDQRQPAIEDYVKIDEPTAWMAIRRWSEHSDPILADLCARFDARRFPKTVEIPERQIHRFLESTRAEIDDLVHKAGFDPQYYTLLDKAEDVPFRPYEPAHAHTPRQRVLPFGPEDAEQPLSSPATGQAIRIHLGQGHVEPIEHVSDIAHALTSIRYRVYRYCVPGAVRDDVERLLRQRHPSLDD